MTTETTGEKMVEAVARAIYDDECGAPCTDAEWADIQTRCHWVRDVLNSKARAAITALAPVIAEAFRAGQAQGNASSMVGRECDAYTQRIVGEFS